MGNKAESLRNRIVTRSAPGAGCCAPVHKSGISLACGPGRHAQEIAATCGLTTAPVAVGNVDGREPEFVRVHDLQPLVGIKRGFAYNKIRDGTFRSITLREPGKKFGVRLVYWPSVKKWLHSLLAQQNPEA